jgi:Nucleotide hydrolase
MILSLSLTSFSPLLSPLRSTEVEGLQRKMMTTLAPEAEHLKPEWRIGEVLGTYYRPNFENIMYPYCPAHIERPKEIRRLYLVQLPEKCFLAVPKNYRLVAVPLFEIYDHMQRYGPVISAIPQLLSRFNIVKAQGATTAAMGAGAVAGDVAKEPANETTLSLHPDQAAMVSEQPPPAPLNNDDFVVDFD